MECRDQGVGEGRCGCGMRTNEWEHEGMRDHDHERMTGQEDGRGVILRGKMARNGVALCEMEASPACMFC